MKQILGINEKNRLLLESLNRSGKKLFTATDAAKIINRPVDETRLFLAYCTRRGWLSRVKRGLYICVPLGTINPQEYKENPWIVASRVFDPCYIGGWSAASHWDLTEQIFNSVCVFTYKTFRKKKTSIQGTEFLLSHLGKNIKRHTKGIWVENTKIQISDAAQTIVDIMGNPTTAGGIRHAADIVENYFNAENVDVNQLFDYIAESNNKTIYKRLGYILEILELTPSEIIDRCQKNISAGYSVLDPTIKNKGTYSRKWNLRVNAEIK